MQLNITDKDGFLNNFLVPLSKVTDSAVISIQPGAITSIIATNDNTVIVNAKYTDENIEATKTLNIPDIKKFCRILQCIDSNTFALELNSNSISYSSNSVRFKYHLYDDNIISVPKLNLSKIDKLEFDGNFTLSYNSIISLIKGSTIATDTNKIYLSVRGNELFGELTDKARANTDSYGLMISDTYEGAQITSSIPLNFEIFRIISSMKFNSIKGRLVSGMGVFTFDTTLGAADIRFIVSALAN